MTGVALGSDFERFSAEEGEDLSDRPSDGAMILASLSHRDLQRLRAAVKKIHLRHYPIEFYSNREADKLIEALSPKVAQRMIAAEVDEKIFKRDRRTGRMAIDHGRLDLMGIGKDG
jgi:hypothetical protein